MTSKQQNEPGFTHILVCPKCAEPSLAMYNGIGERPAFTNQVRHITCLSCGLRIEAVRR